MENYNFEEIKGLLSNDDFDAAIDLLQKIVEEKLPHLEDEILHIVNRHNNLNKAIRNNTLTFQEIDVTRSKLFSDLLNLINVTKLEIESNRSVIKNLVAKEKSRIRKISFVSSFIACAVIISGFLYFHNIIVFIHTLTSTEYPYIENKEQFQSTIDALAGGLKNEFLNKYPAEGDCWGASQFTIGLRGVSEDFDDEILVKLAKDSLNSHSNLWRFKYQNTVDYHMGVSGWTLYGLSLFSHPIDTNIIVKGFLETQNSDGYWTLFPSTDKLNASTYATCFSTLALFNVWKNHPLSATLKHQVESALYKATNWLENNYSTELPIQWFDYPLDKFDQRAARATTALVLHTLCKVGSRNFLSFGKTWLSDFPHQPENIDFYEQSSNAYYSLKIIDGTRQLVVPWEIIVCCDLYKNCSVAGRYKINSWINETLKSVRPHDIQETTFAFIRSEMLISLNYLNNKRLI